MNPNAMTAAHKTLPLGTVVKVVDQRTGKSVRVTINDRGPYIRGRIIDLSKTAAIRLGFKDAGTAKVCIAKA
jgi:rare lipoprotein A